MDLSIKYIGNDNKYWSKIKQRFASEYKEFDLHFLTEKVPDDFNARACFTRTYNERPNIVYVDFSIAEKKCLYFCKLFNRNNITRLSSLVSLHEYPKGWDNVNKSVLVGVRINHFKSSEVQDVVYDPVSLLNVELAKDPEFVKGVDLGSFDLKQILRLSYIEDDSFHIETNSKLDLDQVINIDNHPLQALTSSNRFFVKNYSETDLYYNLRYSYDLEFTYIDDDFFKATEESWLLYKIYKGNPIGYKEEIRKKYDALVSDVKKRKKKIRPMREAIREWINKRAKQLTPKLLKILVIDDSMEIFSELDGKEGGFPYSINIQNHITNDFYQLKRTKPHFIAVRFDETNDLRAIESLIRQINECCGDYRPYILVFNYLKHVGIQDDFGYQNFFSFGGELHLDTIEKLVRKMDNKFKLSESKSRVYFETSSPETIIIYSRTIKALAMTESILYFQSEIDIPMWTTFKMDLPFKMLITVIPHKTAGEYKSIKGCYRALINGLGEKEKAALRTKINKSLAE